MALDPFEYTARLDEEAEALHIKPAKLEALVREARKSSMQKAMQKAAEQRQEEAGVAMTDFYAVLPIHQSCPDPRVVAC